ncbi:hypothetical protein [Aestuariivita boseongensis]|uniref:hypothetical protein n=1 Tax=Aestuariivita boseongensis TaxID=1470562 RepID=UPI0006835319|nr:hypothetical protein [Aestuariivita boseongensis]
MAKTPKDRRERKRKLDRKRDDKTIADRKAQDKKAEIKKAEDKKAEIKRADDKKTIIGQRDKPKKVDRVQPGPAVTQAKLDPKRPITEQMPLVLKELNKGPKGKAPKIEVREFEAARPEVDFAPRIQKYPKAFMDAKRPFGQLREDLPVLMLPVRIETRFVGAGDGRKLRVRIYPDKIGIDAFDPTISQSELQSARAFIRTHDKAPEADRRGHWDGFVAVHGARRAGYLARLIRRGLGAKRLRDPSKPYRSIAPLMPDRWFVTGYTDGQQVIDSYSSMIARDLAFSPDFGKSGSTDGGLEIDPAIAWMFDFQKAIQKGMALEIPVSGAAKTRIDELYVTGVKSRDANGQPLTPAAAATLLDELLESQIHDRGAGFVPTGSATNNTSDVEAGWSQYDVDPEAIYQRNVVERDSDPALAAGIAAHADDALLPRNTLVGKSEDKKAYRRLGSALGLRDASALKRYDHRTLDEASAFEAMNTALWPVTWGETFNTMMSGPNGNHLSTGTRDWVQGWFRDHVKGGPHLPSIRVGNTPYGVLPVQSVTAGYTTSIPAGGAGDTRREAVLKWTTEQAYREWYAAAPRVLRLAERPVGLQGFDEPGGRLLEILRQDPNPAHFALEKATDSTGLMELRYEIRNRIVQPAIRTEAYRGLYISKSGGDIRVLLESLWRKAGRETFDDWPQAFTSATHQKGVLLQKKRLLEDTINGHPSVWGHLPTALHPFLRVQHLRPHDYATCIKYLGEMIELLDGHLENNALFRSLFGTAAGAFKGVIGETTTDAAQVFLAYEDKAEAWHPDHFIRIEEGEQTVEPAAYLAELKGYALSFRSNAQPPERSVFPNGREPLLYQLLREAIFRTGTEEDPNAIAVRDWGEVTRRDPGGTAIFEATPPEPALIDALIRDVSALNKMAPNAKATRKQEPVARALSEMKKADLDRLSVSLEAEGRRLTTADEADRGRKISTLSREIKNFSATRSAGAQPMRFQAAKSVRAARLREIEAALDLFKGLNPAQLELLMTQTLGLASWRLDAWLAALPAKRLVELRDQRGSKTGLQIGAYGWVENLQANEVHANKAHGQRSQGFVHTPSLNHAKTAAILRSGYSVYGGGAEAPLATDLSSDRMRAAEWIFDAVRRGQDLGDVLGARFERDLKDTAGLAHWIYPLRMAVSERAGLDPDPANPVVDALELKRLWDDRNLRKKLKSSALSQLEALGGGADDFDKLDQPMLRLSSLIDALADAALADGVHALVQGNYARAGAALSAIGDGETPPPELDMLRTRPTAVSQTHRVVLLAAAGKGWVQPELEVCPLAFADPALEAMASARLGPPDQLIFHFSHVDKDGATVTQGKIGWHEVIRAQSGMAGGALHMLRLVQHEGDSDEIAGRVRRAVAEMHDLDAAAVVVLTDDDAAQERAEILDRWRAWARVILRARPVSPADLSWSGEGPEGAQVDLKGFEARAEALAKHVRVACERILKSLPPREDGGPEFPVGQTSAAVLGRQLNQLVRAGLDQARLPDGASGSKDGVYTLCHKLAPRLKKRVAALRDAALDRSGDTMARIAAARALIRVAIGDKAHAAPSFIPKEMKALRLGFEASGQRLDMTEGGAVAPMIWLEKMGYVRPFLRDLGEALMLDDCATVLPEAAQMRVGQWPEEKTAPWIALAPPKREDGATLSCLALGDGAALTGDQICGVVVDEVIDRVPATTTDAGVALHFDAPNTAAPQALLLALPPAGKTWDYDLMVDTVRDTFRLAKTRMVDASIMSDYNQLLPAIFASSQMRTGGAA